MKERFWLGQWYRSRSWRNPHNVPIRNFERVDERLYRGALPHGDAYPALRALGIKTILNLVPGNREDDRLATLHAGIPNWIHVPFSDRHAPEESHVRTWLDHVRDDDKIPIYTHCRGGRHRTGTLIAVYRVVVYGWTKQQAFEEMLRFGWYQALGHESLKEWFFEEFDPARFE